MLDWEQIATGVGLFFLTFVSEDAAALAGATLAAVGKMPWILAFAACFLGIWVGDIALYAAGRIFGRTLLERFWKIPDKFTHAEKWFTRNGWMALVFCRFIPGTRLPTFLAAGFLGMPAGIFVAITGVLALLWLVIFFVMVHYVEGATMGALRSPPVLLGALAIFLLLVLLRKPLTRLAEKTAGSFAIQRWRHWEFWPAWAFYFPIALNYLRLAIRYRSLTLPTCANPCMSTGGMIGESKFQTLKELAETSPDWVAAGFLIPVGLHGERTELLRTGMDQSGLSWPVVLKPDVGQRGSGFKIAPDWESASAYLRAVTVPVVAQEYLPGPHEAGIFFYRFPEDQTGRIFAITEKVFPEVVGDGHRTLKELILADPRAGLLSDTYLQRFAHSRDTIPDAGEKLKLVEAGNHAQGCIFRDGGHLWSEQLEARINEISCRLPGFFIGRYDVRFASVEEFRRGEGFSILELNGAASEATNAYDASQSLVTAYKILFRQWELVFAVGEQNRRLGHHPDSLGKLLSEWRRYDKESLCHPLAD